MNGIRKKGPQDHPPTSPLTCPLEQREGGNKNEIEIGKK